MKSLITFLACLVALCSPASRAADILNMGFYLPGIRDANLADVHITLQLWADEVGKAHGINATAYTYSDMAALYRDSMGGKINLIVAPGMEIAETFTPEELAAGFVGKHHGTSEGLALIVRANDDIRQFGDLTGKKVLHLSNDRLSSVFLENQCRQHAGAACADLFQVNEEKRNSQAIHKVFFGQADAALVSISALHAANELNPQIRQRLRSLLEWKTSALSYGLMSARTEMALRNRVVNSAMQATTTVRGKQLLELFKTDFMDRVSVQELKPYWQLHREHQASANRKARKK
jgi:ABC-type phosphate/phosphonate transport system substrate-binding protein